MINRNNCLFCHVYLPYPLSLARYNSSMDLHRTTGRPDWEEVADTQRTSIQRLAAATHGIITPPNIITFAGLAIVLYGLYSLLAEQYWIGLGLLAAGRLLDVLDGVVAQKTGTKSPLGELLDATVDKIGTLLTIIILFVGGISFWWLLLALLAPQVIISLVTLYKRTQAVHIHPTRPGKLSMATLWVSLVGLIVLKALALSWTHPLSLCVYIAALTSCMLALYALWQYTTGRD